jgi:hypothetical protein
MTPREIRTQISILDKRIAELEPWVKTLLAARERWMFLNTPGARWTTTAIEEGVARGGACPTDPALEPFNRGLPGLRRSQEEILRLREVRSGLEAQLPSPDATAANQREAATRAAEIAEHAQRLDIQAVALRQAVSAIADLALDVALEIRELWKANHALDAFCTDADIPRPVTQRRQAPRIPAASAIGVLLNGYFTGEQPEAVDSNLVRAIRAAARKRTVEAGSIRLALPEFKVSAS